MMVLSPALPYVFISSSFHPPTTLGPEGLGLGSLTHLFVWSSKSRVEFISALSLYLAQPGLDPPAPTLCSEPSTALTSLRLKAKVLPVDHKALCALCHHLPALTSSTVTLALLAPATPASSLFLRCAGHSPTSGPLHWL